MNTNTNNTKIEALGTFGAFSRYALDRMETRFGTVEYFVTDFEQMDPKTGLPAVVFQGTKEGADKFRADKEAEAERIFAEVEMEQPTCEFEVGCEDGGMPVYDENLCGKPATHAAGGGAAATFYFCTEHAAYVNKEEGEEVAVEMIEKTGRC